MKKEKPVKANPLKMKTSIKAGDTAGANKAEISRINKEIGQLKGKIGKVESVINKLGSSPGLRVWIRKRGE
ncbi:MAG: hypothetical protein GY765_06300 [bacterium]|nr:hypothetical protein [bacterium]